MSNPLPKADIVIIGLGAAGGIAAHVLTQAGISVVGLEAGPRLGVADFLARDDEISGMIRYWTGEPKYNHEIPTWRPDATSPTMPPPIPPVSMANMVGGTSVHYGAQSWRFLEDDFTPAAPRSRATAKRSSRRTPPWLTGLSPTATWSRTMTRWST